MKEFKVMSPKCGILERYWSNTKMKNKMVMMMDAGTSEARTSDV